MEEQLTYYDDDLEPMGQAPRSQVHAQGLLHLVVHCWIVSPRPDGLWVWFQKRSPDKAEFPNYYDIAVGGHVSAGEAPQEAVLREIWEEVGLELEPAALEDLGVWREDRQQPEDPDREAAQVYLAVCSDPLFAPGEEVAHMIRVRLDALAKKELHGAEQITIWTEEGSKTAPCSLWCRHPGEFAHVLLPALRKRGLCP